MLTRAIVALCLLACAGCGSDGALPVAPSPPPSFEVTVPDLPMEDGPYVVGLTGFALSEDPTFPTCSPIGVPREGTAITTRVLVTREDREWVVRVDPAGSADLEIRFHAVPSFPGMYVVSGSARGCARDQAFGPDPQADIRLCIDGAQAGSPAHLDGRMSYSGLAMTAFLSGTFAFSDRGGATARCGGIELFLRTRGPF